LGSWRGSIFVMMCVLFTCVNVSGFMHWWGLTIDITSMNIIIISVGLCVDFCAHIVHGFLTGKGSKGRSFTKSNRFAQETAHVDILVKCYNEIFIYSFVSFSLDTIQCYNEIFICLR